jgi:hypothetical protein
LDSGSEEENCDEIFKHLYFIYILIAEAHIKLIQRMNYLCWTLINKANSLSRLGALSYPHVSEHTELYIFTKSQKKSELFILGNDRDILYRQDFLI